MSCAKRAIIAVALVIPFVGLHSWLVVDFVPMSQYVEDYLLPQPSPEIPYNVEFVQDESTGAFAGRALLPLWSSTGARAWAEGKSESLLKHWQNQLTHDTSKAIDDLRSDEKFGVATLSCVLTLLYLALVHIGASIYGLVIPPTLGLFSQVYEPSN